MKKLVAISLLLLLASCATRPVEKIITQKVEVPVTKPCEAEKVPEVNSPLENVSKDASLGVKVSSALAEVELRRATEKKLRAALKGCTDPLPADKKNVSK